MLQIATPGVVHIEKLQRRWSVPLVEEQTRLSIKNILLATVFTEPSEAILSYAVGLARRYGSKMSLTGAASPAAICGHHRDEVC